MRSRSSLFLAANSSSERMPRWRRSSSSMSRSRISKRAVAGAAGGGGGGGGARRRGGGGALRRLPGRGARADAEGGCGVRVVVAVLVGVLVGVGGTVAVPRLHLRRDCLAPATADDLVDL